MTRRKTPNRSPFRPRLDRLEAREVPATFLVTTFADTADPNDGVLSLREAIGQANATPGADNIRFAVTLPSGGPPAIPAVPVVALDIARLGRLPAVSDPLSIDGATTFGGNVTVSAGRQGRVFGFLASAGASSLSNLTVADGLEVGPQAAAGGIFNAADLTLTDVLVQNNTATTDLDIGRGGGLFNAPAGTARLNRARFTGNVAPDGAAVYNLGTLVLVDSDLSFNRADSPPTAAQFTGSGGAIFNKADNSPAVVTAVNTRFDNNTALDRGGAIYSSGGRVTVTGGEIANNTVSQPGGLGGGVFTDFGTALNLSGTNVTGNQAAADGGGLYTTLGADSALNGVKLEGNRAGGQGGGLFNQTNASGLLRVNSSLIRANTAAVAGGGVASNGFGGPAAPFTLLSGITMVDNAAPAGAGLVSLGRPSVVVNGSNLRDPAAGAAVAVAQSPFADASYQTVGRFTAYGTGAGVSGVVRLVRPGQADLQFSPFEASFVGGVRVAVADVDLDGTDDVVVGAGPGGGPRVVVYSGFDGRQVANFFAFEPSFRNGAHVGAAGSVRVDGGRPARTSFLTVGAGDGGGPPGAPRVRGFFNFAGVPTDGVVGASPVDFFVYDVRFRGGVRVAAADLAGDGSFRLVTIPGPGGGPDLRVWDVGQLSGTTPAQSQQLPGLGGDVGYTGGGFVTASGGAILVGPDSTGRPPLVDVFTPVGGGRVASTPRLVGLGDDTFRGGVRVSAGAGGLAAGYGPGGRGRVRGFAFNPLTGDVGATGDTLPFGDRGATADVYVGLPSLPGNG